jgi:fermentation-respiration switch protein FrsA (DUF1100 family)
MRNKLLKSMITAVIFYGAILSFFFFFQRNLQYAPRGKVAAISYYHLNGFTEKFITTEDGVKLLGWYIAPSSPNQKIILHFHGNGGNLADRAHKFKNFAENGFGVFAITYRGYSGSENKKSTEKGLALDAKAALGFLLQAGYKIENIIFFGESLGSGVSLELASSLEKSAQPLAIILESPFSSVASVAKSRYPFLPVDLILHDKFESDKFVKKISAPILIFHGTADSVVSYDEGEKLFAAITSQKKFITVEGVGHLDFGEQFLTDEINKFLTETK